MQRRPQVNKWLTSTVKTYTDQYGLTDKPVIYEVGSRDGNDGVELAARIYSGDNLWKDSTIVLFEANPPQQKLIEEKYPEALLIKEAILDKAGTVEFLQLKGDKNVVGSSTMDLTRTRQHWAKNNDVIKVPTRRLDDVIKELKHENTQIDIMKIDIEGYTAEALRSLGKYLTNVRVFHLETEVEGAARAETNLEIVKYMEEQGYRCMALEYEWPPSIQDQVWLRNV